MLQAIHSAHPHKPRQTQTHTALLTQPHVHHHHYNNAQQLSEPAKGAVTCPFFLLFPSIIIIIITMDWTDGSESSTNSGNSGLCMDVEETAASSPATLQAILQRKKAAVEAELQRLALLPPHSSHVIHRKRVAHKALELLGKQERTPEEADELSSLLGALCL